MPPPFNTITSYRTPGPGPGNNRNPTVWKVPPGVHRIRVTTWGSGRPYDGLQAIHYVEPGQIIRLRVGGGPYDGGYGFNGAGGGFELGYIGDVLVTSEGYGATDIRVGGDSPGDRVQVAGGRAGRAVYNDYDFGTATYNIGFDPVAGGSGAATILAGNLGTSDGVGGASPQSFGVIPGWGEVYSPPRVAGERAIPGAGGGGWVGGNSGVVLMTGTFPTNYIWATPGTDGTDHCVVTPTITGLTRDDVDDDGATGTYPYNRDNGRIDIEWHGRARGWTAGRVSW